MLTSVQPGLRDIFFRKKRCAQPRDFYEHPAVQARIAEYCGGQMSDPETFTAEYLSGVSEALAYDRCAEDYFISTSRSSFFWLLEQGMDIFRAAWDRTATLGVLDIEYFNVRFPAEAYFNPERVFTALEPVYRRIHSVLQDFGIQPVTIMTGQGYHFAFKVHVAGAAHEELAALGSLPQSLTARYCAPTGRRTQAVPLSAGLAFDGMGRLQEYLVHLILKELQYGYAGLPVVCTDVAVGGAQEAISLDLSMYADPLYTRDIRCPFSTYQKHKVCQGKYGSRAAQEIPVMVTVPRQGRTTLKRLLQIRRDFSESQKYARQAATVIPEHSAGVRKLIAAYRSSPLYAFHEQFDAVDHDPVASWPETYDRFDLASLPPCVARCLQAPNDHLLKPTNIQTLVRVLMKKGWHPKHIAGLVRSKLERDHGWGPMWVKYDPSTRANYYVRLFAAMVATGLDREIDLNCQSHAEKGYCQQAHCGHNLTQYRW